MKMLKWQVGVVLASLLLLEPMAAQVGTSTITGRVTDPTGAVVPAVQITIIHTATNFRFMAETNAEGLYRVPSLQPGVYRVTFEAAGFKRFVRETVELRSNETLAVNALLQLGEVTESIEITGRPQLLETETSAMGTSVEGQMLYRLPIYARWINSTLQLVPGLTQRGFAWGGELAAFNVAGQRNTTIGFFEDGVNANDQMGGTQNAIPVQNAVAEVKILTTALPAEYGHTAGGVISVVKKTGTNEFHGMASVFGRSRRMQHRRFFDMYRSSQPMDGLAPRQVFYLLPDTNFGGPVLLPKLYDGRNKTFWFFGFQKQIEKQTSQHTAAVPTLDMKAGDFSFGGIGNPIYDPLSTRQLPNGTWVRDPFPDKRVPLNRLDPVAVAVVQFDP